MLKLTIDKQASRDFLNLIENGPDKYRAAAEIAMNRIGDQMVNDSVDMAPYLRGNLGRSIHKDVANHKKVIVGTDLDYARIHDEGGVIRAKNKPYLVFKYKGQWYRKKQVTIRKYKGRGYFTPAFEKLKKGDAMNILKQEIFNALD